MYISYYIIFESTPVWVEVLSSTGTPFSPSIGRLDHGRTLRTGEGGTIPLGSPERGGPMGLGLDTGRTRVWVSTQDGPGSGGPNRVKILCRYRGEDQQLCIPPRGTT